MRITRDRMVGVLGPAPKPDRVWERQFDYFDDELARLARTDWDKLDDGDFWYYFHDLAYVELQPELFRYLFPACLKYWYETLMRNDPAHAGDSEFHYGLVHGQILERMLSARERQALLNFFRDGFLDRVEAERGFHYEPPGKSANSWIARLNSLGMVAPVIGAIWTEWWTLDHPGKAVSAIMYASGLIYLRGENPIYRAWTREAGGGGPYLTEDDSNIYDRGWLAGNIEFLRGTLSVDYVLHKLNQAAAALSPHPEAAMARRVADDAKTRTDILEIRIGDLVENLAHPSMARDFWE